MQVVCMHSINKVTQTLKYIMNMYLKKKYILKIDKCIFFKNLRLYVNLNWKNCFTLSSKKIHDPVSGLIYSLA